VRPGLSVTFTAETYPDHEFGGKVVRIAPVATIVSGVVNYEVAISIARDVGWLRPDMTTNVNIITARHRAMLVPANCIHRQDRETFVYIRSSANAHAKQIVTTGPRDANEIEVTSGLSQDSKVLMSPEGAGKS
jgi:HlyD family secretion protein